MFDNIYIKLRLWGIEWNLTWCELKVQASTLILTELTSNISQDKIFRTYKRTTTTSTAYFSIRKILVNNDEHVMSDTFVTWVARYIRQYIYINDTLNELSMFHIRALTLILLKWTIWRAPNNASKWRTGFNLLATDFFFQISAHSVFKMWVIQKPNKVALWNKRHFEEKKMEIIQHV